MLYTILMKKIFITGASSGIGLALCRQILFNHNGSIKIDNYNCFLQGTDKIKQGVEVVLSLPKNAD